MYNTPNRAAASFILYTFGQEVFDHAENFNGSVYFYFNVNRDEPQLKRFYACIRQVGDLINELKTYDNSPS